MATYLRSLVQLCCGERGTLQTNTGGMCGECSQWMDHTGFATAQSSMNFPGPHCLGSMVLCNGTVPSGHCVSCTSQEDPLEKGKATHSSMLAWRIPWGHKELDMISTLHL